MSYIDINDTYAGEAKKYRELKELGNQRSTSGTTSFTSSTSGVTYNSVSGDTGILNQLAALPAIANSLVSASMMNKMGSFTGVTSISAVSTLTTTVFGQLVKCTGTTYTVTVPTPVSNGGMVIKFWNNASGNVTLSTPADNFVGFGITSASTYVLSAGQCVTITSDGTNWFVLVLASSPLSITPTLQNSWTYFGNGYLGLVCYKDSQGLVYFDGFIKGGTKAVSTLLFTLPAGWRPATKIYRVVKTFDGITSAAQQNMAIYINTDGTVIIGYEGTCNNAIDISITPFLATA